MATYIYDIATYEVGQLQEELIEALIPVETIRALTDQVRIHTTRDLTTNEETVVIPNVLLNHVPLTTVEQKRKAARYFLDKDTRELLILLRSVALLAMDEINLLRVRMAAQDSAVASASSLANLKTLWATAASNNPIPERTKTQLYNAIRNRIDGGEADADS